MTIGERVRYLRYDRGIDFHVLARGAGIARSTLHNLESGRTKDPKASVLARVARALSITPAELIRGAVADPFPARVDTVADLEARLARLKARWESEGVAAIAAGTGANDE